MALNKLDKHAVHPKLTHPEEWPRSERQIESTEPEARSHPRPGAKKKREEQAGNLRLVPADEEERAEDAIDGPLSRKVADDEA